MVKKINFFIVDRNIALYMQETVFGHPIYSP
jgi:hypothetical protein